MSEDARLERALEIGSRLGLKPKFVQLVLEENPAEEPTEELLRTEAERWGAPIPADKHRIWPGYL